MSTPTLWIEPTGQVATGLRRYSNMQARASGWSCAEGWHQALIWTGHAPARFEEEDGRRWLAGVEPTSIPALDPRWPAACEQGCGYRFSRHDQWQVWQELLYRRAGTEQLYVLHPSICPPGAEFAPAGATWDSWWYPASWRGEDGIAFTVRCPRPDGVDDGRGQEWGVDRPSATGVRWTRSGDPRTATVSATPSIAIGEPGSPGHYHGFLIGGVLTDHIG